MRNKLIQLNYLNFYISFAAVLIGLNLFLSVPTLINSEEIVYHQYKAAEPDQQFENVLYLAAGVALVEAGISSTKEAKDHDFILYTAYSRDAYEGEWVKVEYTFYSSNVSVEEVSAKDAVKLNLKLQIDHNIDTQVAVAMKKLLQKADIEADPSREAEIYGLLSGSRTEPQDAGQGSRRSEKREILEEPRVPDIGEKPRRVRFDTSVSMSGLLLFGRATEFFHYGTGSILRAGTAWRYKTWSFTLGVKTALFRVFNDIGVEGGPLYLSTTGANLQFGIPGSQLYRFAAGASGGAAIITVDAAENTLSKTVPYVDFGVHSGIALGERFSLGGEIGFLMIFDEDLLIMGASPALILQVEL